MIQWITLIEPLSITVLRAFCCANSFLALTIDIDIQYVVPDLCDNF